MFDISLLGTGGMMPLPGRWLTAMIGRYNGSSILIDCGEGTQITLRELGWSFKSIDYICFTHYHGDHIGGLPGLLLTIGNSDRREPLILIGPKGLSRVVKGLLLIAPDLPFRIEFIELENNKVNTLELGEIQLTAFPVDHGMPCLGYSMTVSRQPKFIPEQAKALGLPVQYWGQLQKGNSVEYDGKTYTSDMVLGSERKGLKVTYCTDTRPAKSITEHAKGADLFICEGMYGDDEKQENAKKYKHMTIYEAAELAKEAGVGELWLTHYSPALIYPEKYKDQVKKIFNPTYFGYDRKTKVLKFSDD
ncbi:ribonuclease Z [Vallitalea okinawensis]|uniref:ribonuclease Z n=1 Tax=Vallitalea okinawensis TaxID=2078660 RepID=UPI000CFB2049|nr:ribonuclease Z [Vallitalea okinawensis]